MTAQTQIELFGALFYVCMVIAIIGLGLAVLFFFVFDIPGVYALMTGKAKRQTVERMAEQNSRTGRLYQVPISENIHGAGPVVQNPIAATINENTAQLDVVADTSILSEQIAETSVLSRRNSSVREERQINAAPGIHFEITEDTLVIHTTEII